MLPGLCSLAASGPAFPSDSQDIPETWVPEGVELLESQWAQGTLSAQPLHQQGLSLCQCFFCAETGSAHDLETGNLPCKSQFPQV